MNPTIVSVLVLHHSGYFQGYEVSCDDEDSVRLVGQTLFKESKTLRGSVRVVSLEDVELSRGEIPCPVTSISFAQWISLVYGN